MPSASRSSVAVSVSASQLIKSVTSLVLKKEKKSHCYSLTFLRKAPEKLNKYRPLNNCFKILDNKILFCKLCEVAVAHDKSRYAAFKNSTSCQNENISRSEIQKKMA